MELGTGVFLSAVFLGTVALFIATKDRWNWKKIFLWPLAVVVVLSLVGGIVAYAYKQYEERPKVPSEFKGIQLGEKFQDAIFKHGKAEREEAEVAEFFARYIVEHESEKGTPSFEEKAKAYKKAKDALAEAIAKRSTDGGYWFGAVYVNIKNNKIDFIAHNCKNDSYDGTELNGIRCGSTGDEILNKFGSDVRVLCSMEKNGLRRAYDVVKYGTRYYLDKNTVHQMAIFPPAALESNVGKNWDKCS